MSVLRDVRQDTAEKEQLLRNAIRIHPAYGSAYTNLGVVLARTDRFELRLRGAADDEYGRLEEALKMWEDGYNKSENLVTMGKKSDCINLGIGNKVGGSK